MLKIPLIHADKLADVIVIQGNIHAMAAISRINNALHAIYMGYEETERQREESLFALPHNTYGAGMRDAYTLLYGSLQMGNLDLTSLGNPRFVVHGEGGKELLTSVHWNKLAMAVQGVGHEFMTNYYRLIVSLFSRIEQYSPYGLHEQPKHSGRESRAYCEGWQDTFKLVCDAMDPATTT